MSNEQSNFRSVISLIDNSKTISGALGINDESMDRLIKTVKLAANKVISKEVTTVSDGIAKACSAARNVNEVAFAAYQFGKAIAHIPVCDVISKDAAAEFRPRNEWPFRDGNGDSITESLGIESGMDALISSLEKTNQAETVSESLEILCGGCRSLAEVAFYCYTYGVNQGASEVQTLLTRAIIRRMLSDGEEGDK